MTAPIRWGILGAAKFAREWMGPAIHAARGAELSALATSSSPEKAAPFSAFAPGLRLHQSYDALLADPEIDAVYIPLPNHLHVEWTLNALDAGKHVLCEKPLCLSAGEFDGLIAKRDATGLLAAEAYMIVHHPQWQRARALIQEGAIGDLVHADAVFTYDNSNDPQNYRNDGKRGGGGLPDIGVYTFGSVRWATGQEPEAITHADLRFENGADIFAHVTARFPGFTYTGLVSMRMFLRQSVTFHGTTGVLEVTCPFNPLGYGQAELHLSSGDPQIVRVERFPGVNQYVAQVEAFGRSIREGIPYPWTLENARSTQAMIDAVFAAAG